LQKISCLKTAQVNEKLNLGKPNIEQHDLETHNIPKINEQTAGARKIM
jgi:hypothetical protein